MISSKKYSLELFEQVIFRGQFSSSVTEQSGIQAGDGGFDVSVKGSTDLQGGVISSTQAAVDAQRNSFETASLTTSDVVNTDSYHASALGVSVGSASSTPTGSAGVGSVSGNQTSTTKAGISGIAGDPGTRTDVDGANALARNWNTDSLIADVHAQVAITQRSGSRRRVQSAAMPTTGTTNSRTSTPKRRPSGPRVGRTGWLRMPWWAGWPTRYLCLAMGEWRLVI